MEFGKRSRSASNDKKFPEKPKTISRCKCLGEKKKKEERTKGGLHGKEKPIKSFIPVLKGEKIDLKYYAEKPKQPLETSKLPCSCPCTKNNKHDEDFELKLRILEEKEKSIAEYYLKIEETLRKIVIHKDQEKSNEPIIDSNETPQNNIARKMTSEPAVVNTGKAQSNILIDFENNVEQISSIWLKTSSNLYKTLKNLKKNPSLDPMEFEVENVRIKLAIKQAKSLTLVKTKSVIAEAKKLYHHGEMIRNELEKLLSTENLKLTDKKCPFSQGECQQKGQELNGTVSQDGFEKVEADGTGDSGKGSDLESIREINSNEENEKKKKESDNEFSAIQDKTDISDEKSENQTKLSQFTNKSSEIMEGEMEALMAELAKKNETITALNSRIFELQKACNEHLYRYNELQVKLSEFQEKIQWNQVLWKQIGKLKERIQGLQQSNKQLEAHKRELESKITKLDKELERLIKLNHLLNQRKYLLTAHECSGKNCRIRENEFKIDNEKNTENNEYKNDSEGIVLSDKQNAINQLKTVLGAMKDQENFAQKQIAMFQSKIEALEKKNVDL